MTRGRGTGIMAKCCIVLHYTIKMFHLEYCSDESRALPLTGEVCKIIYKGVSKVGFERGFPHSKSCQNNLILKTFSGGGAFPEVLEILPLC